jgi:hypothetical protein
MKPDSVESTRLNTAGVEKESAHQYHAITSENIVMSMEQLNRSTVKAVF